jgi:predicted nucleic acid-binding protein
VKFILDACVLYPTVMREMLLGVAKTGAYEPLWSQRLLDEWEHVAARGGPEMKLQATSEIALACAAFPKATVALPDGLEARLWLPDETDIHVLAAAVAGSADGIITLNAKDFPRGILAEEGLMRQDPDGLLFEMWQRDQAAVEEVGARVLGVARSLSGKDWQMRALLKKARLPKLAKALQHL